MREGIETARLNGKQIYNLAERGKNALREELLKMGFEL